MISKQWHFYIIFLWEAAPQNLTFEAWNQHCHHKFTYGKLTLFVINPILQTKFISCYSLDIALKNTVIFNAKKTELPLKSMKLEEKEKGKEEKHICKLISKISKINCAYESWLKENKLKACVC